MQEEKMKRNRNQPRSTLSYYDTLFLSNLLLIFANAAASLAWRCFIIHPFGAAGLAPSLLFPLGLHLLCGVLFQPEDLARG